MSKWKPFVGRFSVIRGLYSTGLVLYLGNRSIGFHPLRWLGGILVRQCARQQFRHIKVKGGTMNMVDRLARLPCKTCGGKKWWTEGEIGHEVTHPLKPWQPL